VLAALPGITPEQVNGVLAARRSVQDAQAVLASLEGVRDSATVETGRSLRVSVVVRFDDGTRAGADIVILLADDDQEPYRILSWRDDFDQIASAGG
jgi:general secretion pathway protein K